MTRDNQQLDSSSSSSGTTRTSGRRRMGGYQPRSEAVSNGVEANSHTTTPQTPPQAKGATENPAAAPQASAPVRKTRMGSPAAPVTTPQKTSAPEATASAPTARRRMGASSESAPVTRQRMGGTQAAPPAAPQRMGSSTSETPEPAARQRMGATSSPTPAATEQPAAAPAPEAGTRMGGPAPTRGPVTQQASDPTSVASTETSQPRWVRPALIIAGIVVLALVVVLGARWLRTLEPIQEFITTYDGHASQPDVTPSGIPAWLGWQHFLNMFFIVLIVRTGLQVRNERKPPAYWTAKKNSFFSPPGAKPKKVSLSQWLHQSLDVLWLVNGLIFVVLLIVTDHWMRIVPTSWDIFPNMVSGALQYASLDWPTENGWVHYNALQVMAYFVTVFIAAPLAIISGIRISTWWPDQNDRLNKIYPVEVARAIHFPVMLYFVFFTIAHVFLVFFTGALRNLNHMYTSRDVVDWWGLIIFLASLLVIAVAWFLTQPLFTRPVAAKMGQVSK